MKCKLMLRMIAIFFIFVSLLSFVSCSDDEDSSVAVQQNDEKADAEIVNKYYNWIEREAFVSLPSEAAEGAFMNSESFKDCSQKQKLSLMKDIIGSVLKEAVQAAKEYENSVSYSNGIAEVKKMQKGVYEIKQRRVLNGLTQSYDFKLTLSEERTAIKLESLSDDGKVLFVIEMTVTDEGYILWQRLNDADLEGKWTGMQFMFKSDEWYETSVDGVSSMPASIYGGSIPEGFAGKK